MHNSSLFLLHGIVTNPSLCSSVAPCSLHLQLWLSPCLWGPPHAGITAPSQSGHPAGRWALGGQCCEQKIWVKNTQVYSHGTKYKPGFKLYLHVFLADDLEQDSQALQVSIFLSLKCQKQWSLLHMVAAEPLDSR